jgi:A/G-specific adenine glycosylase
MDFGATVCKPAKPDCQHCPLASRCAAFKEGMIEEIPMKAKKLKRVARVFHYLYAEQSAQVLITKRDQKDIWQGLYELPMKESDAPKPLKVEEVKEVFLLPKGSEVRLLSKGKQRLTHQDLTAYFYACSDLPQDWGQQHSGTWVDIKNLSTFGFPKLVRCFLEEKQLTLNI